MKTAYSTLTKKCFTNIPQRAVSFLSEETKKECNKGIELKLLEYPNI